MSSNSLYLITVFGCVEPEIFGPYETFEQRDADARKFLNDNSDGGVFKLYIDGFGRPSAHSYLDGELDEQPDEDEV